VCASTTLTLHVKLSIWPIRVEKLVEESDERHHLSILLNKRDAERAELREADQQKMKQRIAVSAKEVDKSKPLHVHTGAHSHPAASPSER